MKRRHLLMGVGLAGAAWLAFFGDKSADTGMESIVASQSTMSPAAPAGQGVIRSSTLIEAKSEVAQGEAEIPITVLKPRAELVSGASIGDENDRLFASKSWESPQLAKLAPPPPPPTAPPLPFSYVGKQTVDGRMEVFLARGDEIFVVGDQTVIQNTYRVVSIKPPMLSLLYLPLTQIQQLAIGVPN